MTPRRFVLVHDTARDRAMEAVRTAPAGHEVLVKEPTRNGDQNSKFHALCTDLSKSGLEWAGREHSLNEWKVLLVSGHAAATKEAEVEIVIGLEGELVNIRESTALMSTRRSSSLIEYSVAFCAMHGVRLSEPARQAA